MLLSRLQRLDTILFDMSGRTYEQAGALRHCTGHMRHPLILFSRIILNNAELYANEMPDNKYNNTLFYLGNEGLEAAKLEHIWKKLKLYPSFSVPILVEMINGYSAGNTSLHTA
ncbi:hypothetical protein WUBG_05371 [Wuchereria bancrofti]|uniref:Uncharacterized protein n=1 Tax=Wuchereria bancrofti TaxID=6293 RepID=J9ENF5_WUCBA|nr:hypothetical protein WUBG_05371 [Wuchereria bancrofti]